MRSLPGFSEVRSSLSRLRTTPVKKPRTECCCQPVVFIIAAIVVPCLERSNASTLSCLVSRFGDALAGAEIGLVRPVSGFLCCCAEWGAVVRSSVAMCFAAVFLDLAFFTDIS